MKTRLFEFFLFGLVVLPSILPAILGFNVMGTDTIPHLARAFNFHESLLAGQSPPRWAPNLFYGYGLPAFSAGANFPYFLTSFFHFLGATFAQSYVITEVLSHFFGVLGVYLACSLLFKKRIAALGAAAMWAYGLYNLRNIYSLSAFWQIVAMIYPGWSLYAVLLGKRSILKSILLQSLLSGILFLSHPPSAILFIPFVTILFTVIVAGTTKSFLTTVISLILGLGISATITLPTLFERNYLLATRTLSNLFMDSFAFHWKLLSWSSAKISYLVYAVLLITIVWVIKTGKLSRLLIFSFLLFAMAIFFSWEGSLLFWENIPFLKYVLYPFRFFVLAELAGALVAGVLLENLNLSNKIKGLIIGIAILANLAVFWSGREMANNWREIENLDLANYRLSASTMDEIIPMGISYQVKTGDFSSSPEFIFGEGEITEVIQTPKTKLVKLVVSIPSIVSMGTLYYPGWQTLLDDREVFPNTSFITKDKDYTGMIVQPVGVGVHKILIRFQETPLRNLANLVSFMAIAGWVLLLFFSLSYKHR